MSAGKKYGGFCKGCNVCIVKADTLAARFESKENGTKGVGKFVAGVWITPEKLKGGASILSFFVLSCFILAGALDTVEFELAIFACYLR